MAAVPPNKRLAHVSGGKHKYHEDTIKNLLRFHKELELGRTDCGWHTKEGIETGYYYVEKWSEYIKR